MEPVTECKILTDHPYNEITCFADMLNLQRSFGGKFIPFDLCKSSQEVANTWNLEIGICLLDEWTEVLHCLPWKHWKKYKDFDFKLEETRYEAIDCLHFLLNLALLNNVNPESLLFNFWEEPATEVDDLTDSVKELFGQTIKGISLVMHPGLRRDFQINYGIERIVYGLNMLFILLGMGPKEVYEYYCRKNQENYDRQERGY